MFERYPSAVRTSAAILALTAAWVPFPARAAGQPTPVTLGEARKMATRNGPDVLLAERREAIARAQVDVAGALPNPIVGLQTASQTARLTTSVGLPVQVFGQRGTAVAAAQADAEVAVLEIEAVRIEARWNATSAWLDLWTAQERARLLEAAATDAARVADIARERFAAGSAPRVDEVRTRGERARAHAEAAAALTVVAGASARLAVWLGATPATPWRAAGVEVLGPLPAESEAFEQLASQHPTLRRDRAQTEAAKRHVRAEQRLRWPVVTAQVSVAQNDPTLPATDVAAGLSFEAPVLSLRGGAIARARAEQALAQASTDIDLRRLAAQLDDAYRASDGAALRARALEEEVLPALEEARRMTEDGYRDGRVDLLRVIDAQRAALDARLAALDARSAWQHALADLERAIGVTREDAR
jgi:cobalt-zinc-cadmium efflux system outer membrane protein